jgi:HSP20 family protein
MLMMRQDLRTPRRSPLTLANLMVVSTVPPHPRPAPSVIRGATSAARGLRADLVEHDTAYELRVEVPGIPAAAIETEVLEHTLIVRAQATLTDAATTEDTHTAAPVSTPAPTPERWLVAERPTGAQERRFTVSPLAILANATAQLADGLLTITVPKATPAGPTRVPISVR